jgi:hypothetical protein
MRISRPHLAATVAALALLAAALTTWLLWPSGSHVPGADRVRQYIDVKSCLLTGAGGVAAGQAAAAWAGMQDASLATRTMVSYQPVTGPATAPAALPYLASLAQRQCKVIVAVGAGPVAAVGADAARFDRIRFVVVAAAAHRESRPNVTAVSPAPPAQVRAAIRVAVSTAAQQAAPQ